LRLFTFGRKFTSAAKELIKKIISSTSENVILQILSYHTFKLHFKTNRMMVAKSFARQDNIFSHYKPKPESSTVATRYLPTTTKFKRKFTLRKDYFCERRMMLFDFIQD